MKAIVNERYGSPDVLKLKEVTKPTPGDDEILIKVKAASVNAYDWHMLRAKPFFLRLMSGLFKPKNRILGVDVAGRVEVVGNNVKQFKPGDGVFGDISGCGGGGFAEYVCAPENAMALKPAGLSFEKAAAVPMAAITALQGLRDKGKIQSGQKVLINGTSGGVGTFAVQIAKAFGAEVTAVCSTGKMEMVRSLSPDQIIDYTKEDFTKSGQTYNLLFVANGNRSILDYKRALSPKGIFVLSGGSMAQFYKFVILNPWVSKTGGKKMITFVAQPNQKDLLFMTGLLEAGKVKPVIDRCYPLGEVAEAIRYLEDGHAKGKVVIIVEQ